MNTATFRDSLAWVGYNALRLLFPMTLPWVPLFLSADYLFKAMPEGTPLHGFLEHLLVPGGLALSVLFSMLLYRIWPGFLRISQKVPLGFLITRTLLNLVLVYVILTVVTLVVSLLLDPPPWQSENPQYIPLVFFAVVFYPPMLTPTLTIIAIWRSIVKRTAEWS